MMKATIQPERVAVDRQDVAAILERTKLDLLSLINQANEQSTYNLLKPLVEKLGSNQCWNCSLESKSCYSMSP